MSDLLKFGDIKISFDVPDGYFMALEFSQDVFDCIQSDIKFKQETYQELKTA